MFYLLDQLLIQVVAYLSGEVLFKGSIFEGVSAVSL